MSDEMRCRGRLADGREGWVVSLSDFGWGRIVLDDGEVVRFGEMDGPELIGSWERVSGDRELIDEVRIYRDADGTYAASHSAGGTWNHRTLESLMNEIHRVAREREADLDIAAGRTKTTNSAEEFLAELDQ